MKITHFFAGLLLTASASAGVYKWVDSDGAVHFSDKPPATAAEKLDIATRRTDPEEVAARLSAGEKRAEPETIVADQAEQERLEGELRAQREENCAQAQRALDSLLSATRVYEPLPGGGRRYLEQEEVDQRKAAAQRDVAEWCDNSA